MKRLVWLIVLAGSLHAVPVTANMVVGDIRVEGLQRISAGTVFNYLPVQVGETLTADRYKELVRSLFQTGFFTDVRLESDGDVLVIIVTERPSIAEINIDGNQDISDDDLEESLRQIGLAEGRVFDRSLLDRVEQELGRQYLARGKYAVRISTRVDELARNRVAINIDISEGQVARIRQISIIGNEAFDEDDLLDQFDLSTPNWLTWLTKRDRYSKVTLTGDLEKLRSYYLDRGYLRFNVDSAQVSITPDRKHIYLTINVTEGEQYTISDVRLAGDLVLPEEQLKPLLSIAPGQVFSRAQATESATRLSDRLGDEGYAFANVNTIPEIEEETREVVLTLFLDPGRRVYVRRINMTGNERTHDEVMRRELRQMEGAWFSTTNVDRSRTRLERLGYFDEVNVETPAVPGSPDQVDVNYSVTERRSGNLILGAGFSQASGVVANASINQDNFMGTGKSVSFEFSNSKVNRVYAFGFTNPYYTIDGVSRGINLYYRQTDAGEANLANYNLDRVGGDVNFGIPLGEFSRTQATFEIQKTKVKTHDDTPTQIKEELEEKGSDRFLNYIPGLVWTYDSRNRGLFANAGALTELAGELALPGSDWQYYRLSARQVYLKPLIKDFTFAFDARAGYGDGFGSDDDMPFYENFYAGGVRSVRGFKANTLGPRDPETNDPLGGSVLLDGTFELIFPTPFGKDAPNLRLSAFTDFGQVYADEQSFDFGQLRYSVGVALQWLSPFGPLTFSYAQPLNPGRDDEEEKFQFTVGTPF